MLAAARVEDETSCGSSCCSAPQWGRRALGLHTMEAAMVAAQEEIASAHGERPRAIVVVSDARTTATTACREACSRRGGA